jgi:hypothetical protein
MTRRREAAPNGTRIGEYPLRRQQQHVYSASMAAMTREEGPEVSLSRGVLILIGVAVLLVGGAAGFGAGYRVEANRMTSPVTLAGATGESKVLQRFRACMAGKGIKWPIVDGKLAPVGTPPPGVTLATYYKAVGACYRNS